MDNTRNEKERCHCGLKLGFKIAKLALSVATVATLVCMVKEVHRVHRAIENHHHGHKLL